MTLALRLGLRLRARVQVRVHLAIVRAAQDVPGRVVMQGKGLGRESAHERP